MEMSIGACKILTNLTEDEKATIKKDLTLPNPTYASIIKFSPYTKTNVPPYLFYYQQIQNTMVVPRGYNPPFPSRIREDSRQKKETVLKHFQGGFFLTPRQTQEEAAEAYIAKAEDGFGDGVIVLPTGKGKSILGLFLSFKLKQRVLVIVHKDDLVDGWTQDAKLCFNIRYKQVGLIKGKNFRLRDVTIATVQTLAKLPPEKMKEVRDYFGMVIVDEFHHSAAKIYEFVNSMPAYYRIGLTATDMRNDGLGKVLNYYFGDVTYRFKETDDDEDIISSKNVTIVIKESNLMFRAPQQYTLPNSTKIINELYIGEKKVRLSDLNRDEIEYLVARGKIKRKPVSSAIARDVIQESIQFNTEVARDVMYEYKQGKSCLVFALEKEHIRTLKELMVKQGIPEEQIQLYYGDNPESNSTLKNRAESMEVAVTIATYSKATEGTNVRAWERIFLAMSFNNEKDTKQAIGRGRRTKKGKTDLVVYDYRHPFIAGIRNHGKTRDRVYKELNFKVISQNTKPLFVKGFVAR